MLSSPASTSSTTSATSEKRVTRQRPGAACEDCRRRKLRCDGKQPRCSACSEAGIQCVITTTQSQRGPKKGHMKALQTRLATLEQRLLEQQNNGFGANLTCMNVPDMSSMDYYLNVAQSALPPSPAFGDLNPKDILMDVSLDHLTSNTLDTSSDIPISELLRADLDQLYFERAHPFVPIIHRRRYFSWSRQATKTEPQTCLQYMMWTLAASLSAQLQHVRKTLCDRTRKLLESLESGDDSKEFTDIEHAQARVLLLIYDFMQANHQQGWMSAGRCFRLLQLMRLYELDVPEAVSMRNNALEPESFIITEEKRRTFWMAYCLDRFISIRREWPLTLNENVVTTRLPAPEEEFQSGQYIEMGFLSEAISSIDMKRSSPFTESIILATIFGRSISHRQQSTVESTYSNGIHNNVLQQFWDRHNWLDDMLKRRADILLQNYPSTTQHADCMLIFTKMLAHTTILYLCKVMESMCSEKDEYGNASVDFRQRSLLAAQDIVNLSRSLASLSYFKVHPFTPLSLFMCVEFFNTHHYLDESANIQIQEVLVVLKDLTSVNNLARDCLVS